MSADASELRSLGHDLTKVSTQAAVRAIRVTEKVAADITRDAKMGAPVDTGNLKNSIGWDMTNRNGEVGAEIGPTANYGGYVEFGTSNAAAQPYLSPAFKRHVPNYEKALGMLADGVV